MSALHSNQKAAIAIAAKKAFDRVFRFEDDHPDENQWRRAEAMKACGRRISEATQKHYNLLLGHFQNLAGDSGAALKSELRGQDELKRQHRFNLDAALHKYSFSPGYAETICREMFHVKLDDASEEQLRSLVITVTSRGRSRVKGRGVTAAMSASEVTNQWEQHAEKA